MTWLRPWDILHNFHNWLRWTLPRDRMDPENHHPDLWGGLPRAEGHRHLWEDALAGVPDEGVGELRHAPLPTPLLLPPAGAADAEGAAQEEGQGQWGGCVCTAHTPSYSHGIGQGSDKSSGTTWTPAKAALTNPGSFPPSSGHLCFQESKRCNGVLLSLYKVHEEAGGRRTLQRDARQLHQWKEWVTNKDSGRLEEVTL